MHFKNDPCTGSTAENVKVDGCEKLVNGPFQGPRLGNMQKAVVYEPYTK